jgi:trehalose-6-phosphate synthase
MGVGVDRVDYTKGILERFLAIERFLEKYPSYPGNFTFVQIGAPSRTHIKRYHDLLAEVEAEAERINWRFQSGKWKPIVFLKRQHSHKEIEPYLSRRRSLPGHFAARWDEPGSQGISRRAAR